MVSPLYEEYKEIRGKPEELPPLFINPKLYSIFRDTQPLLDDYYKQDRYIRKWPEFFLQALQDSTLTKEYYGKEILAFSSVLKEHGWDYSPFGGGEPSDDLFRKIAGRQYNPVESAVESAMKFLKGELPINRLLRVTDRYAFTRYVDGIEVGSKPDDESLVDEMVFVDASEGWSFFPGFIVLYPKGIKNAFMNWDTYPF